MPAGPGKVALSSSTAQKPTFQATVGGVLHFQLVVTDPLGAASPSDTVDITVTANGTPTANAGPDQTGDRRPRDGDPRRLGIDRPRARDADLRMDPGRRPRRRRAARPGSRSRSRAATAQKPTFVAPTNGPVTLHFQLVVTDPLGAASTADSVDVAVNANALPIANAGPNQTGIASERTRHPRRLGLERSRRTSRITYAWTQVDGAGAPITPTVTLSSATAQKPTFTAPNTPFGSTLRFSLVVTDQFGAVSAPAYVLDQRGQQPAAHRQRGPGPDAGTRQGRDPRRLGILRPRGLGAHLPVGPDGLGR